MASWLLERSRKLMTKYLMRAANSSMQDGFKIWVEVFKLTKKKERLFRKIKNMIEENLMANAVLKWKKLLHDERVEYLSQEISFSSTATSDA
jgi:hypothetical protein